MVYALVHMVGSDSHDQWLCLEPSVRRTLDGMMADRLFSQLSKDLMVVSQTVEMLPD